MAEQKTEVKKAKKIHKSVLKRDRQNVQRSLHNKYYIKTLKTIIKKFKDIKDRNQAMEMLPTIFSMIDKLGKKNLIHKNKASRLKSKLTKNKL